MVHGILTRRTTSRLIGAVAAAVVLAGCAQRPEPAPVVFRGTTPGARPAAPSAEPAPVIEPVALPAPGSLTPDQRGVIDYGGYSAVIAQQGDTIDSIASRVGISASALANYNGLPSGHVPRAGDELILPPDAPVQTAAARPSIDAAPLEPVSTPAPAATTATPDGQTFDLSRIERAIDDTPDARAETATSPSEQARPEPPRPETARPAEVRPEPASPEPPRAEPAPSPAQADEPDSQVAALPPATTPPPVTTGRFVRPVSGEIVRPFSRSAGTGRSDGIDFAAPAGSEVVAVAPGQVALVSEAIGGNLGTVVLIRHENQVLTVYGRVGNVAVAQGDRVRQGQTIGTVAPAPGGGQDSLHFEVRRGTEPVDPGPFFGG